MRLEATTGRRAAAAIAGLLLAGAAAASERGAYVVLPEPLEPSAEARFTLRVARGERGADRGELASLGDAALQVLSNDARLWMPATSAPTVEPPAPGLYLVGVAPREPSSSLRSAKTFVPVGRPADGRQVWRSRLGHRLELVPDADPLAPRSEGRMPLSLFLEGRPLSGAVVTAFPLGGSLRDYRRATTNAAGRATLELDRGGWWLVHAVHKAPDGTIAAASLALPPPATD